MTATFNYQNKKFQVKFDPVTSQLVVTADDSTLKYIEINDGMFTMVDFKNRVERMTQNLNIQPQYS